MTEEIIFFDTDCLSAFLWAQEQQLLINLYSGRMILPQIVYDELSKPGVPHLKTRVDNLIASGDMEIRKIEYGSNEYKIYIHLTRNPESGCKVIGKGEAAAISMAYCNGGILASNNFKDIKYYIEKFNLSNLSTADILHNAFKSGIISETEGNVIWNKMLIKRRKLPANTFSDYIVR